MTGCRVTAVQETGRKAEIWNVVLQCANQYSLKTNGSGRVCWTGLEALPSISTMKSGLAQQSPCHLQLVTVPERPLWSPYMFSPRFTLDRPVPLLRHSWPFNPRLYKRRKVNDFCSL